VLHKKKSQPDICRQDCPHLQPSILTPSQKNRRRKTASEHIERGHGADHRHDLPHTHSLTHAHKHTYTHTHSLSLSLSLSASLSHAHSPYVSLSLSLSLSHTLTHTHAHTHTDPQLHPPGDGKLLLNISNEGTVLITDMISLKERARDIIADTWISAGAITIDGSHLEPLNRCRVECWVVSLAPIQSR